MGVDKKDEEGKPKPESKVKEIRPVPRTNDTPAGEDTSEPKPINGSCLRDALKKRSLERAAAKEKGGIEILMVGEPPSSVGITGRLPDRGWTLSGEGIGISTTTDSSPGGMFGNPFASRRIDSSNATILAVVGHLKGKTLDEHATKEIIRAVRSHLLENEVSIEQFMDQLDMTEEQKTAEALALEALAKKMTDYWTDVDFDLDPERFSLAGAQSLTIYRPATATKPGFAKKSHIGGEDFIPVRAYVGKRGSVVCVFKAVAVEDYASMEMPMQECFQSLNGFQRYFVEAGLSADLAAINDARNAQKQAEDMAKFGARYDDFGTY